MSNFVLDTFTRSSDIDVGSGETGATWTIAEGPGGGITCNGTAAYNTTAGSWVGAWPSGVALSKNYGAEAVFTVDGTVTDNPQIALSLRMPGDPGDFDKYITAYYRGDNGNVFLDCSDGSVNPNVNYGDSAGRVGAGTHTFAVEAVDDTVSVFWNGMRVGAPLDISSANINDIGHALLEIQTVLGDGSLPPTTSLQVESYRAYDIEITRPAPSLTDTFTRTGLVTATPSDSGHNWTDLGLHVGINGANPNAPIMSGGVLTATGGAGGSGDPHYWSGQPDWAPSDDHSMSARILSVTGNSNFGVVAVRCVDGVNPTGYVFEIDDVVVGTNTIDVFVYAVVAGVFTYDLNGVGSQPYVVADATNFVMEARAVGNVISLWLDGIMVWSRTVTLIAGGGTGFIALDPGNTHPTYMGIAEVFGYDFAVPAPPAFWTGFEKSHEVDGS